MWWGAHQLDHGDLSSISHLDYLNKFHESLKTEVRHTSYTGPKNTVLFLHGDSYTWKLRDTMFDGICDYKFIGWSNPCKYHLDSTKRNVLVIEVTERLLRNYYGNTQIIDQLTDTGIKKKALSEYHVTDPPHTRYSSLLPTIDINLFFNKYINQNLEYNLFNYKFIMPVFGCKAAINCYLFNRASGDAVISEDKQFLFFKETLDPTGPGSSLSPVSDDEVARLVDNFNTIYDYYKASGFREIYLSIIPNTVTIVRPEGYNNLIPRIQNDKRLKMKVIDIYTVCKTTSELLFMRGDTHWNKKGKQKWVDMVNEVLRHPRN